MARIYDEKQEIVFLFFNWIGVLNLADISDVMGHSRYNVEAQPYFRWLVLHQTIYGRRLFYSIILSHTAI